MPTWLTFLWSFIETLQWRHNGCDGASNHQPNDCLLNRLFMRRSNKTPKLHATGLCEKNSRVTGGLPAQRTSNKENVSIWWRHHVKSLYTNGRKWCCQHGTVGSLSFISLINIQSPQQHYCNQSPNKVWWLCLVPTSTTRFANDVGYRMAKM